MLHVVISTLLISHSEEIKDSVSGSLLGILICILPFAAYPYHDTADATLRTACLNQLKKTLENELTSDRLLATNQGRRI